MTSDTPFTPDLINTLLCDFLNPAVAMPELAQRHNLPLIQLVRFFQSPAISDLLNEIVAAMKDRAELLAAAGLHAIVRSQRLTIDECNAIAEAEPIKPEHLDDPKALSTRTRFRDQARKSSNILLRIGKAAITRIAPSPSPASHVPESSSATPTSVARSQTSSPTPPSAVPRAA